MDWVHAHGTGTRLHDPMEWDAIDAALGPLGPAVPVYSHKGALGHTLGASGLVAVVLNCLAHHGGVIPGNIRSLRPLPSNRAKLNPACLTHTVKHSLVLAAGFGGPAGAIGLSSVESP